jgi:hypothetical protein
LHCTPSLLLDNDESSQDTKRLSTTVQNLSNAWTNACCLQDKKRKAARGGPPGSKRGPSTAMNLFGNTDPYAFAPSPV